MLGAVGARPYTVVLVQTICIHVSYTVCSYSSWLKDLNGFEPPMTATFSRAWLSIVYRAGARMNSKKGAHVRAGLITGELRPV